MDLNRINELGFEKISLWHSLVLLVSFSAKWNILVVLQCMGAFFVTTSVFAFRIKVPSYIIYIMDVLYLIELTFTMFYVRNKHLRKLRYGKIRHWIFILVDIISLIPVELIFTFHYVSEYSDSFIQGILTQNRSLRIYRLFLTEAYYMVTIRTTFKYMILTFFLLFTKSVIVAHIFACIWFNIDRSYDCDPKEFNCYLWYEVNILYVVLCSWRGPIGVFMKTTERIITSLCMLAGFFLIFAYIYPYTFYFSLLLGCKDSVFVERRKRLYKFLENKTNKPELRVKILNYFKYIWTEGENELNYDALFNNVPLSMKKEIFTDIYWEAFRHSHLLNETSRNFKRTLSLLMKTAYFHDGEIVLDKGQEKRSMIFLVQGILQMMAEENEESPLASFSSGTIFGEFSLFFFTPSHAIVRSKGYCELQILNHREILTALMDYPKDKKIIFKKIQQRLAMAEDVQWRKKTFKEDQNNDVLSSETSYFNVEDCIKWLKSQWRKSWEIHKRNKEVQKAKAEGVRLPSWAMPVRPSVKAEFISNFLDLIVLSNVFEEKKDVVCLRTGFPWSIDPSTQFLVIWKYIVLFTSLIPALVYPFCTSWSYKFPFFVYLLSYVVTLVFIVDLFIIFITAVKTKHKMLTKWTDILRHNLKSFTFYLDIIAAMPYQVFILYKRDVIEADSYEVGLFLHPAILKSYVFIIKKPQPGSFMELLTLIRNVLLFSLLIYWASEFVQLNSVLGVIDKNHKGEWVQRYLSNELLKHQDIRILRRYLVSVIKVLVLSIGVPSNLIYDDSNLDMLISCFTRYMFIIFFCIFMGSYYSSIAVSRFGVESFRALLQRLNNFLMMKNVPGEIVAKIMERIQFQWIYDKADYVMGDVSILNSMPFNLRRQVYLDSTFKTLESTQLFSEESADFLIELLENSECVAVPPGSMVVTFGHTSHIITIIHKGYCQVNSHLTADISGNIGRPLIAGPGGVFPLLSSFCNIPSPISVVTVTDCELIVINLNTLISIMIKHDFFKDVFDVLQEQNLGEKLAQSKGALLRVNIKRKPVYKDIFESGERYSRLERLFIFLKKHNIFLNQSALRGWEYFFTLWNLIECIIWPSCFGLLLYQSHDILILLTFAKVFVITNIVIHIFSPYYNEDGLLVSHPFHTFVHYLSSSFFLHVFRFLPVFPVYYYVLYEGYRKPNFYVLLFTTTQVFLGLTNIIKCIGYIGELFGEIYYTSIIKLLTVILLFFNLYVNFIMYSTMIWEFGGHNRIVGFRLDEFSKPIYEDLVRENNIADYYLMLSYWILATASTQVYGIQKFNLDLIYLSYLHGVIGVVVTYVVFVTVSSVVKFTNLGATTCQEQFISFIKYLKYERADEKTIKKVYIFYNYLLAKTRGEDIKRIFGQLPLYLLEELYYPLYRPTFIKNGIFEDADEGFFKILATEVRSVFFTRGSIIIFKNETKSFIYFVHKGKCFVYDWFITLDMGSLIGDLQRTGLMQNKVYALTHVELLRIPTDTFFTILNNFDDLEAFFLHTAKKAESFIKSDVKRERRQLRPVDSTDALNAFDLKEKEIGFEDESHFEDPENAVTQIFRLSKKKQREIRKRRWVIYPYTWKMKLYIIISFGNIVVTILLLPIFTIFGGVSEEAFIVIGVLDFTWLLVVIATFTVGLEDHQKGDVITNFKFIAKNYFKRGLIWDLLTLIPLELLPVALAASFKKANATAVVYLRMIRYLRVYRFFKHRGFHFGMGHTDHTRNCLRSIVMCFWALIVATSAFVHISDNPIIVAARNDYAFQRNQFEAMVFALNYVLNIMTSADVTAVYPKTRLEIWHFNIITILFIYIKADLISTVLSVIYFSSLGVSNNKEQVTSLEAYLKQKDTSPILIKYATNYKTNLYRFSRSENTPAFLMEVPMTIRMPLMKELYIHHLVRCPLFAGLDSIFLDQLIARTKREVFFPGEKIVEQGDVDHRIYFIHTGEVYVVNQTRKRAYVEYVIGRMHAGEFFGEAQGLWFGVPHHHTYRGRTVVETVVLYSQDWLDLRRTFPHITRQIYEKAKILRYI